MFVVGRPSGPLPPRPRSGTFRLCACVPEAGHHAPTSCPSGGRRTAPPRPDGSPKLSHLHGAVRRQTRMRIIGRAGLHGPPVAARLRTSRGSCRPWVWSDPMDFKPASVWDFPVLSPQQAPHSEAARHHVTTLPTPSGPALSSGLRRLLPPRAPSGVCGHARSTRRPRVLRPGGGTSLGRRWPALLIRLEEQDGGEWRQRAGVSPRQEGNSPPGTEDDQKA